MLGFMRDFATVGWYNASYKLVEGFHFIPTITMMAIYPALSRFHIKNKDLRNFLYIKSFKYMLIVSLSLAIGTTFVAGSLIELVYGPAFSQSILTLKILMWANVFIFINFIMGYFLNAMNEQRLFTASVAVGVVLNIILNFFLIQSMGHNGAAIATLVTQAITTILLYYFIAKKGYQVNPIKDLWLVYLCAIVLFIVCLMFSQAALYVIIPVAAISYLVILLLTKEIGYDEFLLIQNFTKKILRKV